MKTLLIIVMCLFSLPLFAQTKGVNLDDYHTIWYDSLYSAKKTRTIDFQMEYPYMSIVLVNKSATITDSVTLFSVTKGYKANIPYYAVDFSVAPILLKNSAGESISSDVVTTLAPEATKEFMIVNFTLQLFEGRIRGYDELLTGRSYRHGFPGNLHI